MNKKSMKVNTQVQNEKRELEKENIEFAEWKEEHYVGTCDLCGRNVYDSNVVYIGETEWEGGTETDYQLLAHPDCV